MNWLMEFGLAHNMHTAVSILVQTFPYQSTNTMEKKQQQNCWQASHLEINGHDISVISVTVHRCAGGLKKKVGPYGQNPNAIDIS